MVISFSIYIEICQAENSKIVYNSSCSQRNDDYYLLQPLEVLLGTYPIKYLSSIRNN